MTTTTTFDVSMAKYHRDEDGEVIRVVKYYHKLDSYGLHIELEDGRTIIVDEHELVLSF